jgi:hypothetical protein
MPLDRVRLGEAITKREFHCRLREWLTDTDDATIGPPDIHKQTAWVHVRDGNSVYKLDADAHREAVTAYLGLVDLYGGDLGWQPVVNEQGRANAAGFGPNTERPTPLLYLYLVEHR